MLQYGHRCAKRCFEHAGIEHHAWCACRYNSAIQAHQMWKMSGKTIEVVSSYQDRQPRFIEFGQQMQHLMTSTNINARSRFVKHEQFRRAEKCTSNKHALLLPARQLTNVTVR